MRLFIANLDFSITADQLQEMFAVFGVLTECRLIRNHAAAGKSKGFGFISFAEHLHGEWAVKAMNGMDINGRELVVMEAKANQESAGHRPKRPRIVHADKI